MRLLDRDQLRLAHRRQIMGLPSRRWFFWTEGVQLDWLAGLRRLVKRADHADVPAALFGRRLRIPAVHHAIREVRDLGGELIAAAALLLADVLADREGIAERIRIFV